MARFRATIKGQRGEASRLGSSNSGITANVNGWDVGVKVESGTGEEDVFYIYTTGGSHRAHGPKLIGVIKLDHQGVPRFDEV